MTTDLSRERTKSCLDVCSENRYYYWQLQRDVPIRGAAGEGVLGGPPFSGTNLAVLLEVRGHVVRDVPYAEHPALQELVRGRPLLHGHDWREKHCHDNRRLRLLLTVQERLEIWSSVGSVGVQFAELRLRGSPH